MSQARQEKVTAGLDDGMGARGPATRAIQAVIDHAEALNLDYAAVDNRPVHDTESFPWARAIEAEWRPIRRELDDILRWKGDLPAFHEIATDVRTISADRDWKTFLFCAYGHRSEEAIRRCPETWRMLQQVPGLQSAMFSIFEPGKHLPPHRGPYNGVLRFHLGLRVPREPAQAGIRIADATHHWHEGEALVFDDAYEHEAWNLSDEVRVVLFVDFEKPTRLPARLVNRTILNLALFTPFIREGYAAHKAWEKAFYGEATKRRRGALAKRRRTW